MNMEKLEIRKKDHIELALKARTTGALQDQRFHYEPLLAAHPESPEQKISILGKELRAPIWVSSMTGGTRLAGTINRNLARACAEFGMGMGLGSCRILMDDDRYLEDFNMRDLLGDELPLWANLGIAQVEELIRNKEVSRAAGLVDRLRADGLIIHVNPLQEWFQMEGDRLKMRPIDTIAAFLERFPYPVIVKEVGQGMGPQSLQELLRLPLQAIEFGAFGGTNFSRLEQMRDEDQNGSELDPLSLVGADALSMLLNINEQVQKEEPLCRELIISGGIRNYLDGYYLISRSKLPAVFGMASAFIRHARGDYETLRSFVQSQVEGLAMASAYLSVRE